MGLFQQVQVKHCYRQANRCADMLARLGTVQALSFVSFDSPPEDVRCVLMRIVMANPLIGSAMILLFLFSC